MQGLALSYTIKQIFSLTALMWQKIIVSIIIRRDNLM